jgi:hypothetical protein
MGIVVSVLQSIGHINLMFAYRLGKANIIPTILDPFGNCHHHST